jgi:heat shock protein HspQ
MQFKIGQRIRHKLPPYCTAWVIGYIKEVPDYSIREWEVYIQEEGTHRRDRALTVYWELESEC